MARSSCSCYPFFVLMYLRIRSHICTRFCVAVKKLHQFFITVHISADHLVHSHPYFPLLSMSPNIFLLMVPYLCIISPKYFNLFITAEVSRMCLGIHPSYCPRYHQSFFYLLSFAPTQHRCKDCCLQ